MEEQNKISSSTSGDKGTQEEALFSNAAIPSTSSSFKLTVGANFDNKMPVFRLVSDYDRSKVIYANKKKGCDREKNANLLEDSRKRGDMFVKELGPTWHKFSNPMITPSIISENMHLQFKNLPIYGVPERSDELEEYKEKRVREFVGFDLDDVEFEELKNFCNPSNLETGNELRMPTGYPVVGLMEKGLPKTISNKNSNMEGLKDEKKIELWTLTRLRERQKVDVTNSFSKMLKYRGIKQFPLKDFASPYDEQSPPELEPGKDVVYRIRVYRPFTFQLTGEKHVRARHSVFNCDIVATGRTPLAALRDRFACRNDLDMRLDRSLEPDAPPTASARTVFPSGFLFINNVFYVDTRAGCRDTSRAVRAWAQDHGLGSFPVRRMERRTLGDITIRLAHAEVYVHQGACEHVFLFSEMRLLARSDPLLLAAYPCHTLTSQNQSIYCTTCAEYGAKWLVTGSDRVPFDPAFFCDVCFRQYLYHDGKKIGDFKAYEYKGNELHAKKPHRA